MIFCDGCDRQKDEKQLPSLGKFFDFSGNEKESFVCDCNHIITVLVIDLEKE